MKNLEKIYLSDTTSRDGVQMQRFNPSADDKIRITKALDEFGIPFVEGGWPGGNDTDTAYFNRLPILKQAKHVAFGMTRRKECLPQDDASFRKVVGSAAGVICLFGKTWDVHVTEALGTTLDENLAMIRDSVAAVKAQGKEMIFDGEHFFDGFKANPKYALECLKTAHKAGADWLVLCDTNGGTLPHEVEEIVRAVRAALPEAKLGIHAHNDCECAVANSLAAVRAGARMVQGTMNGFGERIGNASLTTLIPVLKYKMGFDVGITDEAMVGLKSLSEWIDEVAELDTPANRPIVGENAAAHKGGIHASAVRKNPDLYEHLRPELVGNKRIIPVSEQSGLASLRMRLEEMGVDPKRYPDQDLLTLRDIVKSKSEKGHTFDKAPESFAALALRILEPDVEPFRVTYHKTMTEGIRDHENGDHDACTAQIVLMCHDKRVESHAGSEEGSVDALDKALRKALSAHYPMLNQLSLKNYRTDIINRGSKTGARVRVFLESFDAKAGRVVKTMGVSTNIIRASLEALTDSYQVMIQTHDKSPSYHPQRGKDRIPALAIDALNP